MDSRVGGAIAAIVLLAVVASGVTLAADGYDVDSSKATSVSERSIDIGGQTYTVDSRVSVDPGEEIPVQVTAPDEPYDVTLWNSDRDPVDNDNGNGTGSFTLATSGQEPGTYAVVVESNGIQRAILPVIVRGYEVSTTAPETVAENEEVEVEVDVTATASSGDPAAVSVLVADDQSQQEFEATGGDGSYTATIDASELSPGDYSVYGLAKAGEEAFDRRELLGASEGTALTVEAADDGSSEEGASGDEEEGESEGAESDDSSGSGGTSGGSGSGVGGAASDDTTETNATETNATETNTTETDTDTNATDTDTETTSTESQGDDEEPAEAGSPTETEETDTESGAITPSEAPADGESTTGSDGPGFGALAAILAVSLAGIARVARRE